MEPIDQLITRETGTEIKNNLPDGDALYKRIALGGPGLVAVIRSSDLRILFVNTLFEHYLGYSNTDITNAEVYFTDLLEDYLYDRLLFQLKIAEENIDSWSRFVVYRLKNKNGNTTPYYLYASPSGNDSGEELYQLMLHPDLSKWDMPFTSFITRELFLQHFNSEDFGTFERLMAADMVFWSIGMYRIYEIDDYHIQINNSLAKSFIHTEDKARVKEATKAAIETGDTLEIEFKIITAKQNVKIVHVLAKAIKDKEGNLVKVAGSVKDITGQKSIEEDLKNKVQELYQSNKELEEFAYFASHDLQEPLRKITTFSDRLSEKYKDVITGDGAMYLSRMIASAENMRSLINDLLEFSKVSITEKAFEPVNLNLLLRQVKTDLELTIEETGTIIHSQLLPTVDAIASQMKQLFVNIFSNAIKFHKPDITPVIHVETSVLADEEKIHFELDKNITYYKLQVTDNGIGFEEEYATRIFQVFQRLHGKSEYPGSGIGLSICKKIVEYHHGAIYAENVPGIGARFVFILPQHQPQPM